MHYNKRSCVEDKQIEEDRERNLEDREAEKQKFISVKSKMIPSRDVCVYEFMIPSIQYYDSSRNDLNAVIIIAH